MTRRHLYDPECLGCTDPDQLPGWLAAERERADALAARSAAVRESAERADAAVLAAGDDWRAVMAARRDQYRLHGEANAHAQHAMSLRAHADRVEAAHPRAAADRGGEAR